jgi:hypothetical protein
MINPKKNSKGVTLLELILGIATLAICSLPLMSIFAASAKASTNNLVNSTMVYLAESKMEEMLAWDFFSLENSDYENTGVSGNFSSPLNNYQWRVEAFPINPTYVYSDPDNNVVDINKNFAENAPCTYLGSNWPNSPTENTVVCSHSYNNIGGNYLRMYVRINNAQQSNKIIELWSIRTPN